MASALPLVLAGLLFRIALCWMFADGVIQPFPVWYYAALLARRGNLCQPRQQLFHLAWQLWRFHVSRHDPDATP
jgi:hypothetical protein